MFYSIHIARALAVLGQGTGGRNVSANQAAAHELVGKLGFLRSGLTPQAAALLDSVIANAVGASTMIGSQSTGAGAGKIVAQSSGGGGGSGKIHGILNVTAGYIGGGPGSGKV